MPFKVQISAKILSWPRSCACCGIESEARMRATATRVTGKRVVRTTNQWWEVPYCEQCKDHVRRFGAANVWLVVGFVAAIVAGYLVHRAQREALLVAGSALAVFVASFLPRGVARSRARKLMRESCACPDRAVHYPEWHGTMHTFVLARREYLESFLAANRSKTRSDVVEI